MKDGNLNNQDILVSIVLPAYNQCEKLHRSIISIIKQTWRNFELIIIDDGSTDETKNIVDQYLKNDDRIKYFFQNNSGLPGKARNKGISISSGELIAFIDQDDEWYPEKLEKQVDLLTSCADIERVGMVCTSCKILRESGDTVRIHSVGLDEAIPPLILLKGITNSCSGILMPKYIFNQIGGFDNEIFIGDDWDLMLRVASAGYSIKFIDKVLYNYFTGNDNSTEVMNIEERIRSFQKIISNSRDIYKKYPFALSTRLRRIGDLYLLDGKKNYSRKNYLKYIRQYPLFIEGYIRFILSFLPQKLAAILGKIKKVYR